MKGRCRIARESSAAPMEDNGKENVVNTAFPSKRVIDIVTFIDYAKIKKKRKNKTYRYIKSMIFEKNTAL